MPAREFGIVIKVTDKGTQVLDEAGQKVETLGKKSGKASGLVEKLNLKMLAVGAVASVAMVKGIKSVISAAGDWIEASNTQEVALAKLRAATDANIEPMVRAAGELQKLTHIGDETGIAMQALALNMGATAEQAPAILAAAADMSAAFGVTMETAVRQTTITLAGFAGELGEKIPQLREFTAEELKAGKGLEFLAERFKGQAEAIMGFGKSVTQVKNILGDTEEKLGDIIKEGIKPFVAAAKEAAIAVDEWLQANKAELIDAFKEAVANAAQGLAVFIEIAIKLKPVVKVMITMFKAWTWQIELMAKAATLVAKIMRSDMAVELEQLTESIASGRDTMGSFRDALDDIGETAGKTADKLRGIADTMRAETVPATEEVVKAVHKATAAEQAMVENLKWLDTQSLATAETEEKVLAPAIEKVGEQLQKVAKVDAPAAGEAISKSADVAAERMDQLTKAMERAAAGMQKLKSGSGGKGGASGKDGEPPPLTPVQAADKAHEQQVAAGAYSSAPQKVNVQSIVKGRSFEVDYDNNKISKLAKSLQGLVAKATGTIVDQVAIAGWDALMAGNVMGLRQLAISASRQQKVFQNLSNLTAVGTMNNPIIAGRFGKVASLLSGLAGAIEPRAMGGPVVAGRAYRVHQDETIVAGGNGYVLNRQDAMAAGGGGGLSTGRMEQLLTSIDRKLGAGSGGLSSGTANLRHEIRRAVLEMWAEGKAADERGDPMMNLGRA